jgi:hypothetical protein
LFMLLLILNVWHDDPSSHRKLFVNLLVSQSLLFVQVELWVSLSINQSINQSISCIADYYLIIQFWEINKQGIIIPGCWSSCFIKCLPCRYRTNQQKEARSSG